MKIKEAVTFGFILCFGLTSIMILIYEVTK